MICLTALALIIIGLIAAARIAANRYYAEHEMQRLIERKRD